MSADPKPNKRVVNRNAGREKLKREIVCRVCAALGEPRRATNRAHIVPKGVGGGDVDDNIVPLCGSGTDGCHGVLTHRNRDGATGRDYITVASAFLQSLTDDERAYAEDCKWSGWLGDYYLPNGALSSASSIRNRVYKRRFPHEEAIERHRLGESISAIARSYGVTPQAVRRIVIPGEKERLLEYNRVYLGSRSLCRTCGTPISLGASHCRAHRWSASRAA